MKGRPTQKTTHSNKNSLQKQCTQTISGQFLQIVPLFPLKYAENRQKSLRKLFVQTVFIWVGGFLGGSPFLEKRVFFYVTKPAAHQLLEGSQRWDAQ